MVIPHILRKRIKNIHMYLRYLESQLNIKLPDKCGKYIVFVEEDRYGWDFDTQEFITLVKSLKENISKIDFKEEVDLIEYIQDDIEYILRYLEDKSPKQPKRLSN